MIEKRINIKLLQKVFINEIEIDASTQLDEYARILDDSGHTERLSSGATVTVFNSSGISVLEHANSGRVASLRLRFSDFERIDLALRKFDGEIETQNMTIKKDGWKILQDFDFYNFIPVGRAAFPSDRYTIWLVTDESDKIEYLGISWGNEAKSLITPRSK